MIFPKSLAVLATAASLSMAATPNGFEPTSQVDLLVIYNSTTALNGAVIPRAATTSQPRIGTSTRLNGTSYAVLMIDIDIPTNSPPATNTLLHWLQTGLVPSRTATTLTIPGSSSPISVFLLENRTNTAPITPYFGPNPPARIPLSHRYTQILVDTSAATAQGMRALEQAARPAGGGVAIGFNASAVLSQAGLGGKVVAGNFFNVTNPGPVGAATNWTGTNGNGTVTNPNVNNRNGTTSRGGDGGGSSADGAGSGNGTTSGGGGGGIRTGNGNGNGFDQGNVTTAGAARLGSSKEFGGLGVVMATYGALAIGAVAFTSYLL